MNRKKTRKVSLFTITIATALCVCSCQQKRESSKKQAAVTEAPADIWKEEWTAVLDSEEKVSIEMRCTIEAGEESLDSMVDASILEIDIQNKERMAKGVFGDEVYLFDAQNMCKADLVERLVREKLVLEKGYERLQNLEKNNPPKDVQEYRKKTIAELKGRVRQVKKLLKTAAKERMPAQDGAYDSDSYMGYLDGIAFQLEFIPHTQGNKAYGLFDDTWWRYYSDDIPYNIELLPVDQKSLVPEELKDVWEVTSRSSPGGEDSVFNVCSLTVDEAGEKAADILRRLGFTNMVQISVDGLVWKGTDADGRETGEVADGYVFGFQTGIEGKALNMLQELSDGYEMYYDREEVEVQVSSRGIVKVLIDHALQVDSITPDIKLLEMGEVKNMIREQFPTCIAVYQEAYQEGVYQESEEDFSVSSPSDFRGTCLRMVYFRIRDPERLQHFTYVPAWELTGYFERVNTVRFYINAIDGSYITLGFQ